MNYSDFITRIDSLASLDKTQYPITIPAIIDAAEQRIYRDADLLSSVVTDRSGALTVGVRSFALPTTSATFITLRNLAIVSPVGGDNPEFPTRYPVLPASQDLLEAIYPNQVPLGRPLVFAMLDNATLLFGPYPDQAYVVEVAGTARPSPLSTSNTTTFLTSYMPDLFLAAAMVFIDSSQKNGDSTVWQGQYDKLLSSVMMEEARRKFQASGWTSLSEPAAATASR